MVLDVLNISNVSIILILHILDDLYIASTPSYLLSYQFVEQKVNVFSCQTFTRKASSMFLKSTRNDRYFPWGALAVATAIITVATKTGYMDESWSLSGITSASIYSSCSFALMY